MSETKDLRVEIKLRNNKLWKAIHSKHGSVAAFCRSVREQGDKISATDLYDLLNLKKSPRTISGELLGICYCVEVFTGVSAEDLFPQDLYDRVKITQASTEISSLQLPQITSVALDEMKLLPDQTGVAAESRAVDGERQDKLKEVLGTLTHREREIVCRRFGLMGFHEETFKQVGQHLSLTGARVRQIEARAIRKLQHPIRSQKLESFIFQSETKVDKPEEDRREPERVKVARRKARPVSVP